MGRTCPREHRVASSHRGTRLVRGVWRRTVLAAATGGLVVGLAAATTTAPPPAAATDGTTSTTAYAADQGQVANPDRGWVRWTGTHYRADRSGHQPLHEPTLRRWREQDGVTVVQRVAYLERFVDRDVVDPEYLQLLQADLDTARRAGVRLVLRFAYSETSARDAPAARAVGHVRQLAPVLRANADVLTAVQAGFVGRWGEWYYSESFTSDPSRPWAPGDEDWRARGEVLQALLDGLGPDVAVQVRTPAIAQRLLPAGHPDAPRVGVHNDCFLADASDAGTFRHDVDRTWLQQRATTALVGGETCAVALPRSGWAVASHELAAYRWTYLNRDYHPDVLSGWGEAGLAETGRRLGHRLRLREVTAPTTAEAGRPTSVRLQLVNDGWAAPARSRPVLLVASTPTGTAARVPVDLDVRGLQPGEVRDVTVPVTLPAGDYTLSLHLPDPSPRLAGDPAYAIRLANLGTWNAGTGSNRLGVALVVREPAPGPSASPAPSPTASPSPGPSASPSPGPSASPSPGPSASPSPSPTASPSPTTTSPTTGRGKVVRPRASGASGTRADWVPAPRRNVLLRGR